MTLEDYQNGVLENVSDCLAGLETKRQEADERARLQKDQNRPGETPSSREWHDVRFREFQGGLITGGNGNWTRARFEPPHGQVNKLDYRWFLGEPPARCGEETTICPNH